MVTDTSLAYYGNRVKTTPEERRRIIRGGISWLLVALVHALFLAVLVIALRQNTQQAGRRGPIETIFDLTQLPTVNAPPVVLIKPEIESKSPPDISSAPITITPPKPLKDEEQKAAPATPGDILKALGQTLACGASNFENLTQPERERCRHQPWLARKTPNGTIVLDAPLKAPPVPFHMTGSDQQRHDMQAPTGCPVLLNTPCLDDVVRGGGQHP